MRAGLREDTDVMTRIALSLVAAVMAFSAAAVELTDQQRADIEARIKPVGEVCLQGDAECGGAATAVASGPRSGEEVFNAACMACHSTGAAGAPKLGDVAAWADRIAKGMDTLVAAVSTGLNAMPPKGMCFDCSDEDYKALIEYMAKPAE